MKREQIIEILQFIGIWILLGLFTNFIIEASFIDFILKYRIYLLIASISYFYYYSIKYEIGKKYNSIRKIIIRGNIYLIAHIFFRPVLNISHELFIALGLIILGLRQTKKIKSKRKIVLQILGAILSFLILSSGLFYLYPDAPDIEGFLSSQKCQIQVSGITGTIDKNDAYLQITTDKKTEDFIISPSLNNTLSNTITITYPSLKTIREENVTIIDSQGNILLLFPQSQIKIEINNKTILNVNSITGNIGIFNGLLNTSNLNFSGNNINLNNEQIALISGYQELYLNNLITHLEKQIEENKSNISSNHIVQNINGTILTILAKFFPANFNKNLKNYKDFQKYFSLISNENINLDKYSYEKSSQGNIKSTRNKIKNNINNRGGNTYLLNR